MPVVELFVSLELGKTKSEVRRLVDGGGAKLNGQKIDDPRLVVRSETFGEGGEIKLSAGKKRHGIVELA